MNDRLEGCKRPVGGWVRGGKLEGCNRLDEGWERMDEGLERQDEWRRLDER